MTSETWTSDSIVIEKEKEKEERVSTKSHDYYKTKIDAKSMILYLN